MSANQNTCVKCHRAWPQVTFKEHMSSDETLPLVCDSCLAAESREGQIAEKIDEAQAVAGEPMLIRQVIVTGVESKTNVIGFRYPTHVRQEVLTITDLLVTFKNGHDYLYKSVPVAVCEAWYAAPSKGSYFIEQIKSSYSSEKVG